MDPVTALGVAAAAIQFVAFTSDFVKGTIKLYNSDAGQEDRHADIASDVNHIEEILQALSWTPSKSPYRPLAGNLETKLVSVIDECHAVYKELDALLRATQIAENKNGRAIEAFRVKWRSTQKKHEIERLYDKLKQLRANTDSCAIMLLRYEHESWQNKCSLSIR